MSKSWRFAGVLVGLAALSAGCDKSSTTPSAGPGKAGEDTSGKKLVGVWEIVDDDMKSAKGESMTVEFNGDGAFKMMMGAETFTTGTWKLVKEEGKTVTVETEVADPFEEPGKGPGKRQKKTFSIVFEDAGTAVMSEVGGKPQPAKLKRKS